MHESSAAAPEFSDSGHAIPQAPPPVGGDGVAVPVGAPSGRAKTTVLYVLSSPHSGSTLLGIVLSSHPSVFCGGELNEIPVPAWIPGKPCSCGRSTEDCPVWGPVRAQFSTVVGLEKYRADALRFERWRSLAWVWWFTRHPSRAASKHARNLATLAEFIRASAGKPVIVDTSKVPGRGLLYWLSHSDTFDVRFLHVVRDGRGVIASRKSRARRVGATPGQGRGDATDLSILWVFANIAYSLVFSSFGPRYLRIRHEDFLTDPVGVLGRLGKFLQVDFTSVARQVTTGGSFPVGHVVAGNRLRFSGEVKLRASDVSWRQSLSPREQRAFWRLAGWLARRYGYQKAAPGGPAA